jgi:hypothetical protein
MGMERRAATRDTFDVLADISLRNLTRFAGKADVLDTQPGRGLTALEFGHREIVWRCQALGIPATEYDRIFEDAKAWFAMGSALCESPIERPVLAALLTGRYQGYHAIPPHVHNAKTDPFAPQVDIFIVPQMAFLRFRVDFMLVLLTPWGRKFIAVECDGADYHQDVSKERKRDGYLASWDILTFRLTGKDIVADPHHAVQGIIGHANDLFVQ